MADVTETQLPGVGVRYEFTTSRNERVGVIHHHNGRREVVAYNRDDPDSARSLLKLDPDDARTMTELLGATQVTEVITQVRHQIEGLALDWIEIPPGSPLAGKTIAEGELRSRTGSSIVAIIRGSETDPAPGPDTVIADGDVAVAVGAPEALEKLHDLLQA